ncbi:MAG: efflux RND transporter periplasmic adaptor subunit [Rhodospirillales bacterium]
MKRIKRSYLIAGGIAAVAFIWILSGVFSSSPSTDRVIHAAAPRDVTPQVRVRELRAQDKSGDVILFGRTETDRKVMIRAETAGRVERLTKKKGDQVQEGDVIVKLAVEDRAARLQEAEAEVEHTKLAYEASRQLQQKEFRSRVQLAETKTKWEAAKAKLEKARLDLAHTSIRAPFDGVLDDLPVEVGDYVEIGKMIGTVADLDPIVVVGEVTEQNQPKIVNKAEAWARFLDGTRRSGTVRFVARIGVTKTRTFRVEVAIPNPDGAIAEGLTTELHIPTTTTRAHFISPAVLTLSDDGALGVKTVDADNTVRFHTVRLVADTADGLWVSGLPEEITLITVGQEFVRVGQKVRPSVETGPNRPKEPDTAVPAPGGSS